MSIPSFVVAAQLVVACLQLFVASAVTLRKSHDDASDSWAPNSEDVSRQRVRIHVNADGTLHREPSADGTLPREIFRVDNNDDHLGQSGDYDGDKLGQSATDDSDYDYYSGGDYYEGDYESDYEYEGGDNLGAGAGKTTMQDFLALRGGERYACGDSDLQRAKDMKKRVQDACLGKCTTQEHALLVASLMQETKTLDETDITKGRDKPGSNFSPFNMNMDYLSRVGCDTSCAQSLGQYKDQYDIAKAVRYFLEGLHSDDMGGVCGFLNFHRGGRTEWDKIGGSCTAECGGRGCVSFRRAAAAMTNQILNDKTLLSDGTRICMNIGHV